ncbi:MAG: hypothetical protein QM733_11125 [Ilumatobacteraceae bacterium]
MPPRRLFACSVVALGVLAACGDGSSSTTTTSTTSTVTIPTTVAPTTSSGNRPTMVTSAPVPIANGGPTASGATTTAGASTTVARRTTTPPPAADGTTTTAASGPLVMRPSGLGTVMFGTAPDTVIAAVTDALGAATRDSGWTDPLSLGSCPGTKVRTVQWGDLSLYFGDESTVVTGRDHFFAYSYGPPAAATASPAGLTIDGGGTLGTTVAALRSAHPSVQLYPADPTAPASFAISDGLTGQLSGVAETDVVTRIQGGIGCGE